VLGYYTQAHYSDIISDNQSVFVPKRLITDNILMAYEATHLLNNIMRGGDSYVVFKAHK
jgi:hypothetical protein